MVTLHLRLNMRASRMCNVSQDRARAVIKWAQLGLGQARVRATGRAARDWRGGSLEVQEPRSSSTFLSANRNWPIALLGLRLYSHCRSGTNPGSRAKEVSFLGQSSVPEGHCPLFPCAVISIALLSKFPTREKDQTPPERCHWLAHFPDTFPLEADRSPEVEGGYHPSG